MHVVTKILVVCCAVLSLVLAALTMAYASNADALRQSIDSERALSNAAKVDRDALAAAAALEKADAEKKLADLQNQVEDAVRMVNGLQSERSSLRVDLEKERSGKEQMRAELDRAIATAKSQADLLGALSAQADKLRNDLFAASKREIELVDRINDLESQREVLEQTARALQEQLKEAQTAIETARAGSTGGGAVAAGGVVEYVGRPIRCYVTEVFKSPAGEDMVVIDEGTNGGIKDNMMMHVTRDRQFVASIIITKADTQQSVGRIEKYGREVEVRNQDMVVTLAAQ